MRHERCGSVLSVIGTGLHGSGHDCTETYGRIDGPAGTY
jgi:hypothetical protein